MEDHRKYDISISKFLNGLFTEFKGGIPALQKILLDALRNRLFFRFGGEGFVSNSMTRMDITTALAKIKTSCLKSTY